MFQNFYNKNQNKEFKDFLFHYFDNINYITQTIPPTVDYYVLDINLFVYEYNYFNTEFSIPDSTLRNKTLGMLDSKIFNSMSEKEKTDWIYLNTIKLKQLYAKNLHNKTILNLLNELNLYLRLTEHNNSSISSFNKNHLKEYPFIMRFYHLKYKEEHDVINLLNLISDEDFFDKLDKALQVAYEVNNDTDITSTFYSFACDLIRKQSEKEYNLKYNTFKKMNKFKKMKTQYFLYKNKKDSLNHILDTSSENGYNNVEKSLSFFTENPYNACNLIKFCLKNID